MRNNIYNIVLSAVVAEVTQPSLGVGYEIGRAVAMGGKSILCLYRTQENKSRKELSHYRKEVIHKMSFQSCLL